jgi:hypothetical protein
LYFEYTHDQQAKMTTHNLYAQMTQELKSIYESGPSSDNDVKKLAEETWLTTKRKRQQKSDC